MSRQRNEQPSSRKLLYACGLVLLTLSVFFVTRTQRKSPAPTVSDSRTRRTALEPDDRSVFALYGGSASCKSCHEQEYQLWESSHHGLAERLISTNEDVLAFALPKSIRHGTKRSQAITTNGQFQLITTALDGQAKPFTAERVIGVNPLRQFLVAAPGSRFQVTELAFDTARSNWFDVYGEEDRRPGEWGHWTGRGMTWNVMCAACHNTRLRKHYDATTDSYATTMAEMSVGCEACHGPMAAHNAWQIANHPKPGSVDAASKDPMIRRITRAQMLDTCGSCHSRRAELTGEFVPGDRFVDSYSLSIPDESDLFYPDGQIRDEDYEFTAFLGSKMHAVGVRCVDCHEPHSGKVRVAGNNLCMSCHASGVSVSLAPQNAANANEPLIASPAPKIDPLTHTHHDSGKTGDSCIGCHMPVTTYMQRHPRHDHGFTIPDPLLTKEFGIPNACGRCHKDRNVDWAIATVDKWYGKRMERASRERAEIVARAKAGESATRDKLIALLHAETNGFWRAVSAGFLRRWVAESNVTAALAEGAHDADPLVRAMSIRSLEPVVVHDSMTTAARTAALAVRNALNDPVRAVRIDAAWAFRTSLDTNTTAGQDLLGYLRVNGDQPSGAMQTGVFMMDRGNDAEAVRFLHRAVQWDTNSAPPHHALAVALSALGRSEEAAGELQFASRLAPRDAELRFKLGLALNEVGNGEGAREALSEAVKLDPQFAQAWYNLGLADNMSGETEKALQSLLRAESLDGNAAQIPYARATILARLGRIEEARAAARRAVEIQPDYGDAQALLRSLSR